MIDLVGYSLTPVCGFMRRRLRKDRFPEVSRTAFAAPLPFRPSRRIDLIDFLPSFSTTASAAFLPEPKTARKDPPKTVLITLPVPFRASCPLLSRTLPPSLAPERASFPVPIDAAFRLPVAYRTPIV